MCGESEGARWCWFTCDLMCESGVMAVATLGGAPILVAAAATAAEILPPLQEDAHRSGGAVLVIIGMGLIPFPSADRE